MANFTIKWKSCLHLVVLVLLLIGSIIFFKYKKGHLMNKLDDSVKSESYALFIVCLHLFCSFSYFANMQIKINNTGQQNLTFFFWHTKKNI